uniref:Mannosyltransferase n=1 Tax=Sphenodon punctatus TaxID=8508 RepID=A0A8D0LBE8_SPHPU
MAAKICWGSLALLRIVWCLLPQTGYLHPDEFFQSPEVMAGDILDLEVYHPWEFVSSSPCRTVVFPLITSGVAFWVIKSLQQLGIWPNSINSYTLLVSPRLLLTAFSFTLDYCVFQLSPFWGADQWSALALLAGSYVTLIFYTRTFANTFEGLLFALLLLLVSSREGTCTSAIRQANPVVNSFIGFITVAGFFNRPTFLAFALLPLLYWTGVNATSPQKIKTITNHLLKLVPSAAFTAVIFITADTLYFTSAESATGLSITPFNFLNYNLNPHNLAQHGTHPRITHFAVNGVMLFGILHISAISSGLKILKRNIHPFPWIRADNRRPVPVPVPPEGSCMLLAFYFVPLALLSLFNHQEPRFLIPLILPLVLLTAQQNKVLKWKAVIIIFNIFGALLFGCLHQGGLIPCLFHLEQLIHSPKSLHHQAHYTLLFTHTYMPPRFLLNMSKKEALVKLIDVAGAEEKVLCQTLGELAYNVTWEDKETDTERTCHCFVIAPGPMRTTIQKCQFLFKNEILIFPHLTMEDPPQLSFLLSKKWKSELGLYILPIVELETV